MDDRVLKFPDVYDAYHPRILRYVTRLVGEAEAEDLTQEIFIKVSQGLESFRGESQLSTWLYRVATNAAIDKSRAASFRQGAEEIGLEDADENEADAAWTAEERPSLEQKLMQQEMYECFERFVKNLPENYRAIFVLSDLEEFTNSEIAEILGLSLDVVKIRLHRGRAKLLQALKASCKAEDWL